MEGTVLSTSPAKILSQAVLLLSVLTQRSTSFAKQASKTPFPLFDNTKVVRNFVVHFENSNISKKRELIALGTTDHLHIYTFTDAFTYMHICILNTSLPTFFE